MDIKLPYGFRDGILVSIDQVEKGLACNCYCPNCNSKLIARKGEVRYPHFSHYKNVDCGWNGESVIHKISKEIIAKARFIKLPRLFFSSPPNIVTGKQIGRAHV